MCTVTYLPLNNGDFILTSNRDETPLRKTIPPKTYTEGEVNLTYPKDELAGGTWIGTSSKKRVVCLLNGGFKNHKRELPYKMSRGIIVKNILTSDNAKMYIKEFDFTNIEPFTLVLVDWKITLETYELVWDGITKHFTKLDQKPKIWSSSTLYSGNIKLLRQEWFANWLMNNKEYSQEEILAFHKDDSLGTPENSVKMKRNFVETVSITSIQKKKDEVNIKYLNIM